MPNPENADRPILVVGPGRSGSSWLLHALDEHPDVRDIIENRAIEGLWQECFQNFWSGDWRWVCEPDEAERRVAKAARELVTTLFATDEPEWVMKLIWRGRPWDFIRLAFPKARYIHLTRSPATNIPSMMEYMGSNNPAWKELAHCEDAWCGAHEEALALEHAGVPYLRIKQEDAQSDPQAVWRRVARFLGLRTEGVDLSKVGNEINVAESTKGRVADGRAPLAWGMMSARTHAVARQLGYVATDTPADELPTDERRRIAASLGGRDLARMVVSKAGRKLVGGGGKGGGGRHADA